MPLPDSFSKLFDEAESQKLYKALIQQLNKDLRLANVECEFSMDILPNDLKKELHLLTQKLMEFDFATYLNLLYVVDVSEAKIKGIKDIEIDQLSAEVSFLILQREWQKVWIKRQFS